MPPHPLARNRFARSLISLARDLRHPSGRRAGPLRIGKHVQEGEIAFVHEVLRAHEHLFGLGREACDDVGTERDVGPQSPHLRAKLDRVLRECRRFIRFKMRSSPDCSDRCRCGISRSSSAMTSSRSRSASMESIDEIRSRFNSGTWRKICFVNCRASACPASQPHSSSDRRRSARSRHGRARPAYEPVRRRRPSAPSANCRGRKG